MNSWGTYLLKLMLIFVTANEICDVLVPVSLSRVRSLCRMMFLICSAERRTIKQDETLTYLQGQRGICAFYLHLLQCRYWKPASLHIEVVFLMFNVMTKQLTCCDLFSLSPFSHLWCCGGEGGLGAWLSVHPWEVPAGSHPPRPACFEGLYDHLEGRLEQRSHTGPVWRTTNTRESVQCMQQ